jgi:nitronate monooxygenase
VSEAGALGFLAAGYKTAAGLERELAEVRALTSRPFGVNLFYPAHDEVDEAAVAAYAERLRGEAARFGVVPGEPRWSDDGWEAKLELVTRERPAVVSFTFGCAGREVVESLHREGIAVWCTVTSVGEAEAAVAAGVDALVVQGAEAGGHQSFFLGELAEPLPLRRLLQLVAPATGLPLVAAGGIADGPGMAAALAAGASAAQVGTWFLLAPEAGTSDAHRRSLAGDGPTRLTRAFTGRSARGIVNRFMTDHDAAAPRGYPEVHYVTAPIRAAARAAGDAEAVNLWAGTGYRQARPEAAGTLVERLVSEWRSAA